MNLITIYKIANLEKISELSMNLVDNSPKAEVPTEYILVDFAHMHRIKGQGEENKLFGTKKNVLANNFSSAKNFFLTRDKYGDVVRE